MSRTYQQGSSSNTAVLAAVAAHNPNLNSNNTSQYVKSYNPANVKMNGPQATSNGVAAGMNSQQGNIGGNVNNANSSSNNNNNNSVVGLHYKIGKKIGEGSFGVIFEGTNIINGVPVAIKFEPRKTEAPQLRDEYRTYKHLQGSLGIPNAYYFGQEGLHNILVIDLLGPSLEDLFDWCGRRFSVKTVVQIAIQMLSLIEEVHRHDLIYRDIKPDNFLIGRQGLADENNVHLVDFGMAKQYRDPRTKQHIAYREKKSLSGTARYMSINTHLGREQLRRDDLEALGHVFFYFLRGQLPWQGLKAPTNKQKYERIGDRKRTTPAVTLCEGLPRQFAEYLDSVRLLPFDAEPAYEEYRMLFLSILDDLGERCDGDFDWLHLNGGKGWDSSINKKPNLHGYGHPNPPNERERRHREQRRSRQHQLQQAQAQVSQQQLGGMSNGNINGNGLTAAQLHQQKLQHLVNRPLPPIKQEPTGNADMLVGNGSSNQQQLHNTKLLQQLQQQQLSYQPQQSYQQQGYDGSNNNHQTYDQGQNMHRQQQPIDEQEKGFWSKMCCQ